MPGYRVHSGSGGGGAPVGGPTVVILDYEGVKDTQSWPWVLPDASGLSDSSLALVPVFTDQVGVRDALTITGTPVFTDQVGAKDVMAWTPQLQDVVGGKDSLTFVATWFTPGTYTFTVPSSTTSLIVQCDGAGGSAGANGVAGVGGVGGAGGRAVCTIAVTGGDVVQVNVGLRGPPTAQVIGGGGGTGGAGLTAGGGGGGASFVHAASTPEDTGRPSIVAGTVLPTIVASPWSGFGNAMSFDGVNRGLGGSQGVDCGNSVTGVPGVSGVGAAAAFCLEAKIKPTVVNVDQIIAGRFTNDSVIGQSHPVLLVSSTAKLGLVLRDNGGIPRSVISATALTAGANADVAASYDGTTLRLFINGVLDASTLALSGVEASDATTKFWIGRDNDPIPPSGPYPFSGTIDEVRWSKTARYTATYAPAITPFTSDANTLGLWHLNSITGVGLACVGGAGSGGGGGGTLAGANGAGGTGASGGGANGSTGGAGGGALSNAGGGGGATGATGGTPGAAGLTGQSAAAGEVTAPGRGGGGGGSDLTAMGGGGGGGRAGGGGGGSAVAATNAGAGGGGGSSLTTGTSQSTTTGAGAAAGSDGVVQITFTI